MSPEAELEAAPRVEIRALESTDLRKARRQTLLALLGVAAVLLGLVAMARLGFFLYAVLVVGAVYGCSWAVATLGIHRVQVSRQLTVDRGEIGDSIDVILSLRNDKPLPIPWLFWEEQVDGGLRAEGAASAIRGFRAGESRELLYRLPLEKRGLFRVGPAVLEASGPLGLVHRFHVGSDAAFVTVYPRSVSLDRVWPPSHRPIHQRPRRHSLFEDPTRFAGTRDYQPQDGIRRIHWRATARAGKLQSRVYEPSVLGGALLAVDLEAEAYLEVARRWAPGLEPDALQSQQADLMELAVTSAASLADFILAGGQKVGLFSNGGDAAERYPTQWSGGTFRRIEVGLADAAPLRRLSRLRPVEVPPHRGDWQRQVMREALARLIPASGLSLASLLASELPQLPRNVAVLLITPALTSPLARAVQALLSAGLDVTVIWIGGTSAGLVDLAVPLGVTVYPVPSEEALARLGTVAL